ncbi:MAG: Diphthamide biosynthesis protein 4 [Pycnora praestabilis]|nr:MAG: Diphthamide biosynthesis protein 4 [Pycnora praestabilis]
MDCSSSKALQNHYEVLELPWPNTGQLTSAQEIKLAYRRTLLRSHPDKFKAAQMPIGRVTAQASSGVTSKYSVDDITEAYRILSNARARADYDRLLHLQPPLNDHPLHLTDKYSTEIFRSGLETIDLDDLTFDEKLGIWFRGCRCGDERGFLVRDEELEREAGVGELGVGCRGCSLWLKVEFEAAEGEVGGEEG